MTFKVCGRNEERHGNTLGPDGEEKPLMLCWGIFILWTKEKQQRFPKQVRTGKH